MKHRVMFFLLALLFIGMNAVAGTNGSVAGIVKDNEGKRLKGAAVSVVGTKKGAYTKADGSFEIINIPAGNYELKITFTGLETIERKITISADQTTNVGSLTMKSKNVVTKDIVVTAQRINDDKQVAIADKVNGEVMLRTAGKDNAQQIALTTTGVLSTGGGISIRGGRAADTRILIDDQDVSDAINGGFGSAAESTGDLKYAPTTSRAATADVQVIRGNASAEYGQTTSGVINQTVKTGRTDRYEAFFGYKTDVPSLWGKAGNGAQALGALENTFDFGLGGPLPGLDGSTFYLSVRYYTDKYRTVNSTSFFGDEGLDVKDIAGNSLGHIAGETSQVRNITGRLPFKLTNEIRLQFGGSWGLTSLSNSDWGWLYATAPARTINYNPSTNRNDTVLYSTVPINVAHQNVTNNFIYSYYVRLNHELSNTSFYEATLSFNNNITENGRRRVNLGAGTPVINGVPVDPSKVSSELSGASFFGGYDVITPTDDYVEAPGGAYLIRKTGSLGDKVIDAYAGVQGTLLLDDNKTITNCYIPNNLTGYIGGGADNSSTNNPYGLTGVFTNAGSGGFEFKSSDFLQFKGNYQNLMQLGDVKHVFQTGVDVRSFSVRRHSNNNPYVGNPFYDVYDDRFGGDIYSQTEKERQMGSRPKSALMATWFVSDQIQYKGINFTPGVRFDGFDPSTSYALDPSVEESESVKATFKTQISPRLFISYPISETSFFTIAYGIYTQVPVFASLFNQTSSVIRRGNVFVGNPDLRPERTNQYNVSYSTQLSDDFAFDVAAYYKDIYSLTGLVYVPANRTPFSLISNGEYGNVRGAEMSLRRRLANNFEFTLNYTLQYAQGTSSSVGSNYSLINAGADEFTGKIIFPLVESPLDYDRRHRINFNGGLLWGEGEGPTIAGMKILELVNMNFTGVFQTGQPFTLVDLKGQQLGDYNGERYPSLWNIDFRLSRRIPFKNIFGDSFGASDIELYVDVINLFNRTDPIRVYTRTKDPDNDGVSLYRQQGEFLSQPLFSKPDVNNPASMRPDQFDRLGSRLYSVNSDINKDGIVTQYEQFQMYQRFVNDSIRRRPLYQFPRQVYFGFNIRF
jgi:outer membrane receptor protein involved in Fe transport